MNIDTILHIFCLILKILTALFIKDIALIGITGSKDTYLTDITKDRMQGINDINMYLAAFVCKAIGCILFTIILIHVACDYIDKFEQYILSVI